MENKNADYTIVDISPEYFELLKKHKYLKEDAILLSKMLLDSGKNFNIETLIYRGLMHSEDSFYYLIKSFEAIAETSNNAIRSYDKSFLDLLFITPVEDLPLHINDNNSRQILNSIIIKWRLFVSK